VQVDTIKPTFKEPGTTRLKLKCDKLLSSFAFSFNLRRYTVLAVSVASSHIQPNLLGRAVQLDPTL
jgi:hypothetical protein